MLHINILFLFQGNAKEIVPVSQLNARMNSPREEFTATNPKLRILNEEQPQIPNEEPPQRLEAIGSNALDLIKDVSQDVAKHGHKINKIYGDINNMNLKSNHAPPNEEDKTSEPSKPTDTISQD